MATRRSSCGAASTAPTTITIKTELGWIKFLTGSAAINRLAIAFDSRPVSLNEDCPKNPGFFSLTGLR